MRSTKRRSIVSKGNEITVIKTATASKPHVCDDCGGPIGEGDSYHREETIDSRQYRLKTTPDQRQNFWRAWGRIPHADKEVHVYHPKQETCADFLRNREGDDLPGMWGRADLEGGESDG